MSRKFEHDRRNISESQLAGKMFNISVVGLSGTAKDHGCLGVGKSCLCNRFVRQSADEYNREHISVLAQSDFNGPIVNNEHWLYWGQTRKCTDEGFELTFSIVEQTEFVDDACFQPFRSGKMEPYYKRCAATKLTSSEKLMYICKNQLGIEKEYEQHYLPDNRFMVDGFLVVFDVSNDSSRDITKQIELTSVILMNCLKTKKPVILVTTKNDEASPIYVKEAERLVNRKEFKGLVPIVETSSHDNVNVDLAFWACVQRDWTKGKTRILSYDESFQRQRDQMDLAEDAYKSLIRAQITDYRVHWNNTYSNLSQSRDFLRYCDLFGQESAQMTFKRHVKKLREDYVCRKMQMYLRILPKVLATFLPDLESFMPNESWHTIQEHLQSHPLFDAHFVINPEIPWQDIDDSLEPRIPFDLLSTPEAEKCFVDHRDALMRDEHLRALRHQFAELLRETPIVPGALLKDVRMALSEHDSVNALPDSELDIIYEDYQRLLKERAKEQLLELFQERSSLFLQYCTGAIVTQEDLAEISKELMNDERWSAMDLLAQDRDLALIRHLGFVQWPIKEHCPAFHACVDINSEAFCVSLSKRARHPLWNSSHEEDLRIKFTVFGVPTLADSLCSVVKAMKSSIEQDNQRVFIDVQVSPNNDGIGLFDGRLYPGTLEREGYIFVYSSRQTFEHVRKSLEQSLLSDLQFATAHQPASVNLPLILLLATSQECSVKERSLLREEGQNRATNLQAAFFDVTSDEPHARFKHDELSRALMFLTDSVARRADLMHIYNPSTLNSMIPEGALNPEVRILLCMMCGDPLVPSHLLEMLLLPNSLPNTALYPVSKQSIVVDVGLLVAIAEENGITDLSTLDFSRIPSRYVEFIISSYHGSYAYKDELVHGYILVYWSKRKASFANMSSLALSIGPVMPIQILALVENESRPSKLSHQLVADGGRLAENLNANFNVSTLSPDLGRCVSSFLSYALANKLQIEKDMQINPAAATTSSLPSTVEIDTLNGTSVIPTNESYDPSYDPGHILDDSSSAHLVKTQNNIVPTPRSSSKHVATASFDDSQFPLYENNDRSLKMVERNKRNLHNYYANLQSYPSADSLDRLYGPNGINYHEPQACSTNTGIPYYNNAGEHSLATNYATNYRQFQQSELQSHSTFDPLAYGAIQSQSGTGRLPPPPPPRPASSSAYSSSIQPPPYSRVAISPPPAYGGYGIARYQYPPEMVPSASDQFPGQVNSNEGLLWNGSMIPQEFYDFHHDPDAVAAAVAAAAVADDAYRAHSAALIYATTGRLRGNQYAHGHYNQFSRSINDEPRIMPYSGPNAGIHSASLHRNQKNKKKRTRRQHHRSSRSVSSAGNRSQDNTNLGAISVSNTTNTANKLNNDHDDDEDENDRHHHPQRDVVPGSSGGGAFQKFRHKDKSRRLLKKSKIKDCKNDDDSEDLVGDEDDDDENHDPVGDEVELERNKQHHNDNQNDIDDDDNDDDDEQDDDDDDDDDVEEDDDDDVEDDDDDDDGHEESQSSPSAEEHILQNATADKLGSTESGWSYKERHSPKTSPVEWPPKPPENSSGSNERTPNIGKIDLKKFNNLSNAISRVHIDQSIGQSRINSSLDEANNKKNKTKTRKAETESDSETSTTFMGTSAFVSVRPGSSISRHSLTNNPNQTKLSAALQKKNGHRNRIIPIVPVVVPPRSAYPQQQQPNTSATNSSVVTPTSGIGKSVTGSFDDKTEPSEAGLSFDDSVDLNGSSIDLEQRKYKLMSRLYSIQNNSTEPPSAFADDIEESFDETEKKSQQLLKSESIGTFHGSELNSSKKLKKAEKKKAKEESKKVRKASKDGRTRSRSKGVNSGQSQSGNQNHQHNQQQATGLEEFRQANGYSVPLFVVKCTQFIEQEGLDMEGIYRVPGNRAHVDTLLQEFDKNRDIDIVDLDIPVNAVATALKDFFMKQLPPIFPNDSMNQIADVARDFTDKGSLVGFEEFLRNLPQINYDIIKFMIFHFVKIVEKSAINSMDSKNLAICWWPTLLQFEFSDMYDFEQKRPHLMNFIQILIDSFDELFNDHSTANYSAHESSNHSTTNLSNDQLAQV